MQSFLGLGSVASEVLRGSLKTPRQSFDGINNELEHSSYVFYHRVVHNMTSFCLWLKSGKKCLDPNLKNEITRSILKINKRFIAHFNWWKEWILNFQEKLGQLQNIDLFSKEGKIELFTQKRKIAETFISCSSILRDRNCAAILLTSEFILGLLMKTWWVLRDFGNFMSKQQDGKNGGKSFRIKTSQNMCGLHSAYTCFVYTAHIYYRETNKKY